jgi:hypothetical protein
VNLVLRRADKHMLKHGAPGYPDMRMVEPGTDEGKERRYKTDAADHYHIILIFQKS